MHFLTYVQAGKSAPRVTSTAVQEDCGMYG